MTDAFAPSFTIAPLAPLAPSSSGPSGPGLGGAIHTDWSSARRDIEAETRAERRGSIARARAKQAETDRARNVTKAQRLAASNDRDTGSESERRATRGSVAKAVAALAHVPDDTDIVGTAEDRATRAALMAKYPGVPLSEILTRMEKWSAAMRSDPEGTAGLLAETYAGGPKRLSIAKPAVDVGGTRGAIQRAQADAAGLAELETLALRYGGKKLHAVIAEVHALDDQLRADPHGTATKLSWRFGAPSTARQKVEYDAHMAAQAAYSVRRRGDIEKGVHLAIHHGFVSDDPKVLTTLAEVLKHPNFPHSRDMLHDLRNANHIALQFHGKAPAPSKSNAGTRSISNSGSDPYSPSALAPRSDNRNGTRAAIARAMGRIS
jgi:hypothetical protein